MKTKMDIDRHKRCLRNQINYTEYLKKERNRLQEKINYLEKDQFFYEHQIKTAIEKKKTGFDREIFKKESQNELKK